MRAENIATILTTLAEQEKAARIALDTLVDLIKVNSPKDINNWGEVKPDSQYYRLWKSRTEAVNKLSRAHVDFDTHDWH